MQHQLDQLDRIVEQLDADDAKLARDRVERFGAAGERAGVRQGRRLARLRPAELMDDDRLSHALRQPARGLELREIDNRLDVAEDDLRLQLAGEEGDVIGDGEARLVAAGDEIARAVPALVEDRMGEDHHAAALPHHRDGTGRDPRAARVAQGDEAAFAGEIAHAVGPRHGEAGLGDGSMSARRRANPSASLASPKPAEKMVALRAPAAAPSRSTDRTPAAGTERQGDPAARAAREDRRSELGPIPVRLGLTG